MVRLPPKPDFAAIEAAAPQTANRRTLVLALIGHLVYCWSNNESLFIYVLMLLMDTDEISAAIMFGTLNTTRARLDLIQRLAATKIADQEIAKQLDRIVADFNECTRIRNEFNHCMYRVNDRGEITHTHSMKIQEARGRIQFGVVREINDARINEINDAIRALTRLNRDIWDFLPRLQGHLGARQDRGVRGRADMAD